jgi:hypothetical protein
MVRDVPRMRRRSEMGLAILLAALVSIVAAGCGTSVVAPPSPDVKAPEEPLEQTQAWNPSVIAEPGGRLFMTYYGGRGGADYRPFFTRSLDGGSTWLAEPIELDTPLPSRNRIGFHQIETSAADTVSATWSIEWREGTVWRVRELRHRRSSDAGETWTDKPFQWLFQKQSNYPQPVTGPNGDLYLLFTEGSSEWSDLRFTRAGSTGPPGTEEQVTLPGSEIPDDQWGTKPAQAAHWPVLTIDPGGAIYAVWQETTAPFGHRILFNRSQDGGNTWLPRSIHLNTPTQQGNYSGRIPKVALDGRGGIYVVWEDFRHGTGDLYFNRSLNGGVTWLDQDVWLTAVRPRLAAASSPLLSADRSGNLYVLWKDIREGPNTLYFTRSLDRGATWMTQPIRVDRQKPGELNYAHRLAHDDAGHVYAAWWQGSEATKGSIRLNMSKDYGATWLDDELVLDSGAGPEGPRFPWLAADGDGGVYVVWSSDRSGRYQLYMTRSTDHGKSWSARDIKITGHGVRTAKTP